jgi:lysine-specific metallo-endopeptidase family protein
MPLTERDKLFVAEDYFDNILGNPQKDGLFTKSELYKVFAPCVGLRGVQPSDAQVKSAIEGLPQKEKDFFLFEKTIRAFKTLYPGLDEEVDDLVTYRGFKFRHEGSKLLDRAKQAVKNVRELATDVRTLIEKCGCGDGKGKFTGFSSDEMVNFTKRMYKVYLDWMINGPRFQRTKQVFVRLDQAINHQGFQVICDADPIKKEGVCGMKQGEFAQVLKADACNRIYLGELFFNGMSSEIGGTCGYNPVSPEATYMKKRDGVVSAEDASILTLFHELTHITAIGDTTDVKPKPYDEATCRERAIKDPDLARTNAENYALVAKAVRVKRRFGYDISDGRGK